MNYKSFLDWGIKNRIFDNIRSNLSIILYVLAFYGLLQFISDEKNRNILLLLICASIVIISAYLPRMHQDNLDKFEKYSSDLNNIAEEIRLVRDTLRLRSTSWDGMLLYFRLSQLEIDLTSATREFKELSQRLHDRIDEINAIENQDSEEARNLRMSVSALDEDVRARIDEVHGFLYDIGDEYKIYMDTDPPDISTDLTSPERARLPFARWSNLTKDFKNSLTRVLGRIQRVEDCIDTLRTEIKNKKTRAIKAGTHKV